MVNSPPFFHATRQEMFSTFSNKLIINSTDNCIIKKLITLSKLNFIQFFIYPCFIIEYGKKKLSLCVDNCLTDIVSCVSITQVVSVTSFNGGDSLDMIPDTVVLGGTFRAFSNTTFYQLLERIEQVIFIFISNGSHFFFFCFLSKILS